jgi:hypothetical protein
MISGRAGRRKREKKRQTQGQGRRRRRHKKMEKEHGHLLPSKCTIRTNISSSCYWGGGFGVHGMRELAPARAPETVEKAAGLDAPRRVEVARGVGDGVVYPRSAPSSRDLASARRVAHSAAQEMCAPASGSCCQWSRRRGCNGLLVELRRQRLVAQPQTGLIGTSTLISIRKLVMQTTTSQKRFSRKHRTIR